MVLPPGYGYSVTETLAAIAAAKKLWDSFYRYDNAPNRIRELRSTFEVAKSRLLNLENQKVNNDQPYVGLDSLKRSIQECEDYLSSKAALSTERAESAAPSAIKKIGQTVKFAFDDRAKRLRSALALEMQQLALFYAELAITRTNDIGNMVSAGAGTTNEKEIGDYELEPEPRLSKLPRVGSGNSEEDFAIKDAFFQLSALSYQYKRSKMLKTAPDVDVFAEKVGTVFRQFCLDCGLSITDIPELDAKTALVAPAFTSMKVKLDLTTPSLKSSVNPLTSTNRLQEEIDMNDEDEGFSAVVDLQKYGLGTPQLRDYDLQIIDRGRLMIWHSQEGMLQVDVEDDDDLPVEGVIDDGVVLKHHLPPLDRRFRFYPRCHPYVMKSDVARKRRPQLEVLFHEPQKVEYYKAEPRDPKQPYTPPHWTKLLDKTVSKLLYVFEHSTYQDRFLSDLRGKKVQRFDFQELWSERKEKGESSQEVVYLWRHRTDRSQHTISFYASKDKRPGDVCPTYEYRVQWFEPPVALSKPKNSVKLRLKRPRSDSELDQESPAPPAKRRSSSLRRFFHAEDSSPDVGRFGPASLPTPPASGAVSSNASQMSYSPTSSMERKSPEEHAQREIVHKFGWLAIQFPSSEVMNDFKISFERALQLGPQSFTLGPPALSTSTMTSPTIPAMQSQTSLAEEWQSVKSHYD